jgi:hypothetical protein
MRQQTPLSVVATIRFGEHERLKLLLQEIGSDVENDKRLNFKATTTYFGRLVVLDNDPHYLPLLLFESQFDGSLDSFLDALLKGSNGLDDIFGKCEGYPAEGSANAAAFRKWMKKHSVPVVTYYAAYKPLTLAMARSNLALRQTVRTELLDRLDAEGKLARMTSQQVREAIQNFVADRKLPVGTAAIPFLNFADKLTVRTPLPEGSPVPKDRGWLEYLALYSKVRMLGKFGNWLLYEFLPWLVTIVLWPFLYVLHKKEKADAQSYVPPPAVQSMKLNKEFFNVENKINKNQMTHHVTVKPGWFRHTTLRVVLWGIDKLSKVGLTAGRLTDVATVHFARWIYTDNGRRLLFTSNFDGPWSAYVGDFVDRTSEYLTGIWSNTNNFPKTRSLIFEGAQDIDGFGWFLRINQLPTEVWYAAFRSETVVTIVSTTQISQDMHGKLEGERLAAWLRRF